MKAILEFPRQVYVDIENPPTDFEEQIRKSFHDYTEGTREEYMYQDKLAYIDLIRDLANKKKDCNDAVMDLMKRRFEYEVSENGEFPNEDDFYCVEFMEDCYNEGANMWLYSSKYDELYRDDYYISHLSDKVMSLIYRAIKVVMDYE